MSATADIANEVRSFQIEIPEEQIDDLRRRIAATRWPSKELVEDRSQGVQLATMRELARYWTTEYDWRKCEARLNALPQFTTEIDGVDIHFIHVRSPHEDALPLIMTHGSVASSVGSVDSAVSVDSIVSADTGRGATTRPTDVPVSPRASVDPLSSSTPVTASSPMRNTPTVSAVRTTQRRRGRAGEAGDTADSTAVGWSVNPVGA